MKIFTFFRVTTISMWVLTSTMFFGTSAAYHTNSLVNTNYVSFGKDTIPEQSLPLSVKGSTQESKESLETLFNQLPRNPIPNLNPLTSVTGAEPRYLAVGGSLTAGVRNGGLYRYSQLTSYANFIARQMGLKNFGVPLFDASEGNGSGYLKLTSTKPFPAFQKVGQNIAVLRTNPLTFSSYKGRIDNLGLPYMGIFGFADRQEWRYNNELYPGIPYDLQYRHYFRRYLTDNNQQWWTSVFEQATSQKADFCTIELGIDDFILFATTGGYKTGALPMNACIEAGNPLIRLIQFLKANNTKMVLSTVPDIKDLPYFHFITPASARAQNGGATLYAMINDDHFKLSKGSPQFLVEVKDTDILLPTENVLALFSTSENKRGISPQMPLESKDVLTEDELKDFEWASTLNQIIRFQAQKLALPLVDLQSLYKRIATGGYITDDGVQIDPSFPDGNFFSADGLHPTALGQAVIANEWIKVINQHYKTAIPLVNTTKIKEMGKE